jgi:hypothetical protein
MENNAEALRQILFSQLASINDKSTALDMERAKATSMIAKDIISLAKLEAKHANDNGGNSKFLSTAQDHADLPKGITGVQQHRIK